jgi:hypothetical protein
MQANTTISSAPPPIRIPLVEGFSCVSKNITATGELLQLWVPDELQAKVVAPTFRTHTEEPYTAVVSVTTAAYHVLNELPVVTATYPLIETLPGDRILVCGSRCRRSEDGVAEKNATIYTKDGLAEAKLCLGDGIEHVQVDGSGRIWVGYFDEGIFGNLGWGAHPIGENGLECFGIDGQKLWSFAPLPGFDPPADLYALNVVGNEAWTCYYTEFPIVLIGSDMRAQGWQTELRGVRALAVAAKHVLAYGGYNENRDSCYLLCLRDRNAEIIADVKLSAHVDFDLHTAKVIGRGNMLHVIGTNEWHQFKARRIL